MKTDFELLKEELRVLNPGITEIELINMTDNLIKFYALGIKAIFEAKNASENKNNCVQPEISAT